MRWIIIFLVFLAACAPQPPPLECEEPYLLNGSLCCLDENSNRACDSDEPKEKAKPLPVTIEELEKELRKTISRDINLTKKENYNFGTVYTYKLSKSTFLGKYAGEKGNVDFTSFMQKEPVRVILLKEPTDFQDFVKKNKDLLIQTALDSKAVFESKLSQELTPLIYFASDRTKSMTIAKRAKYHAHTMTSSQTFFNDITFAYKTAEIVFVRLNTYELSVIHEQLKNAFGEFAPYTVEVSNINFAQTMVAQCSPQSIVAINFEDYGEDSFERRYDRGELSKGFFQTSIEERWESLRADAAKLLVMCENLQIKKHLEVN